MIQTDYTLGPQIRLEPYHIPVVRTSLTRNIATRFAEIKDEITAAFGDYIPTTGANGITLAFCDLIDTELQTRMDGYPSLRDSNENCWQGH
jgi:hypothetical protein